MTFTLFHVWFLILYSLGIMSVIVMAIRLHAQRNTIERQEGPLPSPGIFIPLGIPLIVLLIRVGEMRAELLPLRLIGLGISLYFVVILPWILRSLGRFAVPGAGVYRDHELVTTGPYRLVRHPLYSAAIALWLSAALGTLNWLLLMLWPLFVASMIFVPVRYEEKLLREKFGKAYEEYAEQTRRLIPKFGGRGNIGS